MQNSNQQTIFTTCLISQPLSRGNPALRNVRITDSGVVDLSKLGLLKKLQNLNIIFSEILSSSATPELFSLQELLLDSNKLVKYPVQFAQSPNLKKIKISRNPGLDFKDLFISLSTNSNISELSLSSNNLQVIPEEIGQLTHLKRLYLSLNQLRTLPMSLTQLENLEAIILYYGQNKLEDLPPEFDQQIKLKRLENGNYVKR